MNKLRISKRSSVSGIFFSNTSSMYLILAELRSAPFVKSPDLSFLPFPRSCLTASQPNLSTLSRALNVTNFCSPFSIFNFLNKLSVIALEEILIMYSFLLNPHFSRISEIKIHNSASACKFFVPTKSASNCKNSLNLPGPGFSFLQTVPN